MTWGFTVTVAQTPLHLAQELLSHSSNILGAQNLCPEETFEPAAFPFAKPVQSFRWKLGFLTLLVDDSGTVKMSRHRASSAFNKFWCSMAFLENLKSN